ncbi:MAG: B12-binding domain-containing radical SAM protein [Betaproteobacteria bacterium]
MNVLLIQPPVPRHLDRFRMPFMPLGLAYLAAVLEERHHRVRIVDMDAEGVDVKNLTESLRREDPFQVVGLTVTTWTYYTALQVAKAVKSVLPESAVVLGGPHVTFMAEQTLNEAPWVDYIIRGEGEFSLAALVDQLGSDVREIKTPGVSYRRDRMVVHNLMSPPIDNLDALPLPARHLLKLDAYSNPAIVTSRGCPRRCRFCVAGAMANSRYRVRSVRSVVGELKLLDRSRRVLFYDNTFGGSIVHSKNICRAIIAEGLGMEWSCELRVDNVDKDYMCLLRQAGCRKIQYGVESGSPRILPLLGKGITVEQVHRAVGLALDAGIEVYCTFTIGHPEETREDIDHTRNLMRMLRQWGAEAQAAIVVPFPGTELYDRREELGIVLEETRWDRFLTSRPTFSTPHLSRDEIGRIYFDIMMEFGTPIEHRKSSAVPGAG